MITTSYNPSKLEIEIGDIIQALQQEIDKRLTRNSLKEIVFDKEKDNPNITLKLVDEEGDKHELVLKIIQRSDLVVNQ